jgi:hypothetical protein
MSVCRSHWVLSLTIVLLLHPADEVEATGRRLSYESFDSLLLVPTILARMLMAMT